VGRLTQAASDERTRKDPFTGVLSHVWLAPTNSAPAIIEAPNTESTDTGTRGEGWLVTVFNNEYNTYDEVMTILMVATCCSAEEAYIETWEVDNLGKSVVHYGSERECRDAAAIIAQIGIRVEVTAEL
jgi:hypothetical protein